MQNFTTRFWSKVEKTDGCWNWTGGQMNGGYGKMRFNYKDYAAHRFSFEMTGATIPEGMDIDHICHNRLCVRPEHLRVTTRKQNNENKLGAYKNSKSGIRGVTWQKGKWRVQIGHNGNVVHIGYFTDLDEAAEAARQARLELFTHNEEDRAA